MKKGPCHSPEATGQPGDIVLLLRRQPRGTRTATSGGDPAQWVKEHRAKRPIQEPASGRGLAAARLRAEWGPGTLQTFLLDFLNLTFTDAEPSSDKLTRLAHRQLVILGIDQLP